MPTRRPRPKKGERRIDATIDHLAAQHGFPKPQIRKVINDLLAPEVYGRHGWPFLEAESYAIVVNKLREEQAQQDQKQEAPAAEEASPQNGLEVSRVNGEAPNESQSALELQASPNNSPPAKGPPYARPPCYGWISEESETESEPEDEEMLSDVTGPVIFADIPNPVETLPSKRK